MIYEIKQIAVAADNVVDMALNGRFKYAIVGRISRNSGDSLLRRDEFRAFQEIAEEIIDLRSLPRKLTAQPRFGKGGG